MDTLPPELLCYILSKLDGRSLGCASQVCSIWRDMVNILSRGFNVWLQCCVKDLGLGATVRFTENVDLLTTAGFRRALAKREDGAYWKGVYAEYFRYRQLRKWSVVGKEIGCHETTVTAVAVEGGTVVVGERNGCVQVYDYEKGARHSAFTDDGICRASFPCHHLCITDIALVKLDSEGIQELLIITTSVDGYVNISSLDGSLIKQFRPSYKPSNGTSAFGPYFAAATYGAMLTGLRVYRAKRENGSVAVDMVLKLSGLMYSHLSAVLLTHSKVLAGDAHGVLYVWDIQSLMTNTKTAGERHELEVSKPSLMHQFSNEAKQIVSDGKQFIAVLDTGSLQVLTTDQKLAIVSTDKLSLLTKNCVQPLCLALQGPLLAVGCQGGLVLFFDLWTSDWYMDLQQSLLHVLQTDSQNILSLALTDNGEGTVLVTGGKLLHIFRWRSPSSSVVSSKLENMDLKS